MPRFIMELLYFVKYRKQRFSSADIYLNLFKNLKGIEVGGPSVAFRVVLPIYPVIANLDGVNFSHTTMWEGSISEGNTFRYFKNKTGRQFIQEASDLKNIQSNTYDFLISSNCLEHIANPLKALDEWIRVIKPKGYLLLVLPKKESNFDHKRPVTTFEHIENDYKQNINEHDLTHLDEILALHDLSRDVAAGSLGKFKARSMNNFLNRGLHHHIFDDVLIKEMFKYNEIDLIQFDETSSDYFALGRVK